MTTLTDPPKEQFRLSMLIYDTRYRSGTIQVIALIGFMLLVSWLISNTAQNLAALGKPIDFGFLTEPASYDINQRLIDYNSRDTHLRASIVGLLNTLVVAVLGCATATVIGVVIGVLRLSNNWLVSRIMAVYVEMFRNVPVLLWIVFIMAILIDTLPQPRDFRGDDAEASMILGDSVAITNRGVYIPEPVFGRRGEEGNFTSWRHGFGDIAIGASESDPDCQSYYAAEGPFAGRFGHLFHAAEFSNYRLRCEYRFVGEQTPGGPGWAFRNSGVMLHGQAPESMGVDQEFPVSIEVQLLGGKAQGKRSTANLCTPGTNVVRDGALYGPQN